MSLFYGNGFDKPVLVATELRDLLPAKKRRHYADRYSMAEAAKLWTSAGAGAVPASVADLLGDGRLLSGHFEYSVPVWGGGGSETDLMAFTPRAVLALEAKTDEPLDDVLRVWIEKLALRNPRSPPHRRAVALRYAEAFRVPLEALLGIRYQLLHRTLSAARTAEAAHAAESWMLVQSFPTIGRQPRCSTQRADFDRFVELVGPAPVIEGRAVRLAWIDETTRATDECVGPSKPPDGQTPAKEEIARSAP